MPILAAVANSKIDLPTLAKRIQLESHHKGLPKYLMKSLMKAKRLHNNPLVSLSSL